MSRDKRLVNHKDYSQDSKYSGQYMVSAGLYDGFKPFVHLKLDQACRRTMPKDAEGYDYELGFSPDAVTVCLVLVSGDSDAPAKLHNWQHLVSEYINSLAVKEFNATEAFPEDEHLSNLMKDLSIKLENTPLGNAADEHFVSVTSTYTR